MDTKVIGKNTPTKSISSIFAADLRDLRANCGLEMGHMRESLEAPATFALLISCIAALSSLYAPDDSIRVLACMPHNGGMQQACLVECPVIDDYTTLSDIISCVEASLARDEFHSIEPNVQYGIVVSDGKLLEPIHAAFQFTLEMDSTSVSVEYNRGLYSENTSRHLAQQLISLLSMEDSYFKQPILELPFTLIFPNNQNNILQGKNSPFGKAGLSLDRIFEAQADKTPDAIACVDSLQSMTYRMLDERSNQLANLLLEKNCTGLIPVFMCRSHEMIISILAILKAGCAYVPIDPSYPDEHVRYIIADCNATIILADEDYTALEDDRCEVIRVSRLLAGACIDKSRPKLSILPDDLAYVIYTSGSTGKPKGVMVEHSAAINRLEWMQSTYPLSESDVILQKTVFTFDVSVWEITWWFFAGASVFLLEPGGEKDPRKIYDAIVCHHVSVIHFVPTLLHAFLSFLSVSGDRCPSDALNSLRFIFSSGEALTHAHVDSFYILLNQNRLINLYGPTEAAIDVTYYECQKDDPRSLIPIGVPIQNTSLSIMRSGRVMPTGFWGELCISGVCLARGYLNMHELTVDKFVESTTENGVRYYRTGDIAKIMPDGQIYYLGRADRQVKIRGFRIELDEIQSAMLKYPGVVQAAVIAADVIGDHMQLVAFYLADEASLRDQSADAIAEAIRSQLRTVLPEHMIPHYFIQVDHIPVTHNGKTDHSGLYELLMTSRRELETSNAAELTDPRYGELANIWEQILGPGHYLPESDFFTCGGDSILAISLSNQMNMRWNLSLLATDIYACPLLMEQHALITHISADIESVGEKGYAIMNELFESIQTNTDMQKELPANHVQVFHLSNIQKGMLIYSQMRSGEPVYHDQFVYHVYLLELDADYMQTALHYVIEDHPMLRTCFDLFSFDDAVQIVLSEYRPILDIADLRSIDRSGQISLLRGALEKDLAIPYTFKKGEPPWRILGFHLAQDEYLFLLSFHHALLDGWSTSVLVTDVMKYYESMKKGETIFRTPPKVTYRDHVALELSRTADEQTLDFWREHLNGFIRNDLPFQASHRKGLHMPGKMIVKDFPDEFLSRQEAACLYWNVTLRELCLMAFLYLLHLLTNELTITVGVVTNDRPDFPESERLVGCFLNTLPICLRFDKGFDKRTLLQDIKSHCRAIRKHGMPLSKIAELVEKTDPKQNPLFDAIFNYNDFHLLNILTQESDIAELRDELGLLPNEMTNTLFDFEISKTMGRFSVRVKYSTSSFLDEWALTALQLYEAILDDLSDTLHPTIDRNAIIHRHDGYAMLQDLNCTQYAFPNQRLLHQLFEASAQSHGTRVAVVDANAEYSYEALDQKANGIAQALISRGLRSLERVVVVDGRSFLTIAAIMGILKAGAVFVPVDADIPDYRLERIVQLSDAHFILCDRKEQDEDRKFIGVEDIEPCFKYEGETTLTSQDLAYVIFTSGTTGDPKGVMIQHDSAVNLVVWMNEQFQINETDRALCLTSIGFDLSIYDIFGMLAVGGSIVLAKREQIVDTSALVEMIQTHEVTLWNSVPTTMGSFVDYLEAVNDKRTFGVRHLLLSGDWIPVDLPARAKRWFPKTMMVSLGGATEGTVWSIYHIIDPFTVTDLPSIPYGRPLGNNTFYLLNDNGEIVPAGVPGELYIGGVGVARGYISDPERTRLQFVTDPFGHGTVMYKTGDVGRLLPNGAIEFLGRRDQQVKIRGYRVELEEIEKALRGIDGIDAAAIVMTRSSQNTSPSLAAFYMGLHLLDPKRLSECLRSLLPEYMIPDHYVFLDALPLSSNGKIDRKALSMYEFDVDTIIMDTKQFDDLEKAIYEVWCSVLGKTNIDPSRSFFDQGGNSLLLMKMQGYLERKLKYRFSAADIFAHPTIITMANRYRADNLTEFDLQRIDIPGIACATDMSKAGKDRFVFTLGIEVAQGIRNIAMLESCDVMDVLFGICALWLSEITSQHRIGLQVVSEEDWLRICEADLNEIHNYSQLFHLPLSPPHSIEMARRTKLPDESTEIVFLFMNRKKADPNDECWDLADWRIAYEVNHNDVVFHCVINNRRLDTNRAKNSLKNYVQLIKTMLGEYANAEKQGIL